MKAYTDLEQSKKLAEILPLKSADMRYTPFGDTHPWFLSNDLIEKDSTPCWSLSALLGVIPYNVTFNKAVYRFKLVKFSDHWECYHENFGTVSTKIFKADNPVDVCYEMIIKLHEQNII